VQRFTPLTMRAAGAAAPVWAASSLGMVTFIGPAFLAVSHGRRTPVKCNAPIVPTTGV
jgi:hypothetical protein